MPKATHDCGQCGKQFDRHARLVSHQLRAHASVGRNKCRICGLQLDRRARLENHVRAIHGSAAGAIAPFTNAPPAVEHFTDAPNASAPFSGTGVSTAFSAAPSLHPPAPPPGSDAPASPGLNPFAPSDGATTPRPPSPLPAPPSPAPRAPSKEDNGGPAAGAADVPPPFSCSTCGKVFKTRRSLRQHDHEKRFPCQACGKTFMRMFTLRTHMKNAHSDPTQAPVPCPRCQKVLHSQDTLVHHFDRVHAHERCCDLCHGVFPAQRRYRRHLPECRRVHGFQPVSFLCLYCKQTFPTRVERRQHLAMCTDYVAQMRLLQHGGDEESVSDADEPAEEASAEEPPDSLWSSTYALKQHAAVHTLPLKNEFDLSGCLIRLKEEIVNKVQRELMKTPQGIKWSLVASASASREKPGDSGTGIIVEERKEVFLRSNTHSLLKVPESVEDAVNSAILEVQAASEHLRLEGSAWVISQVLALDLNIAHYSPLVASSYVPTPPWLKHPKKTLVNIQNYGNNDCFRLSVIAALHPVHDNAHRQEHYKPFLDQLNMGNLQYTPMKVADIPRFELLNPTISISVLFAEDCVDDESEENGPKKKKLIIPLYCTREKKENHITLLILQGEGGQNHYVLVRDFNSFLASQTKKEHRRFYCSYCLNRLKTQHDLDQHESVCRDYGAQRVEYAKPNSLECFDSRRFPKLQRVPYTAYYDWESVLVPLDGDPDATTVRTQRHDPVAYSIVVVDWQGNIVRQVTHAGDKDVGHHFVDTVLRLERELYEERPDFPLHMSPEQQADFDKATRCYLCKKGFKSPRDRVRDHEHLQEVHNYRGCCHSECNSGVKKTNFLPLVAHNGFRYDVHHVFRAFINHPALPDSKVTVLPKTHDTYRSATIYVGENGRSIKLLDSFQFFSESLDSITKHLDVQDLQILFEAYPDPTHQRLLRRKGIFCYEHIQSYQQLCSETCLPPKEAFYSSLSNSVPTDAEYEGAKEVWDGLGCTTLLDYMTHYLQSDVLLLASFFTKFKAMTYKKYGLEVCHFVSVSSMTWCQALKFTSAEVELIHDADMYQFFELQKRGGLSCVMKRYSEANIPGSANYDATQPPKYLYLLDVNALYSHEMCKMLPVADFQWTDPEELARVDWENLPEDSQYMYTVEVDLEYDESLWDSHCEWPCAVERVVPDRNLYSPYQTNLAKGLTEGQLRQPKLVAQLGPKKKYILHGLVLSRYLQLGLKVSRFHRGVRYRQEAWLKSYIEDLMHERQKTKLPFEAQAFKQCSNSTYGFLLRNPRFDRNVEIVRNQERFRKLVAKPTFQSFTIFSEDLITVEKLPTVLKLKQCVSAGVTVLDTSKKTMLDLYWKLKDQFGKRMSCLFTDTDSFGMEITSNNINQELTSLLPVLDTSGLLPTHPLHDKTYARFPGRLKIEYGEFNIMRFAAVRSKCYALEMESQTQNVKTVMKCKGVQRSALARDVTFDDYKNCVFESVKKDVSFSAIRTDGKHVLYTVRQNKTALKNFDNKRWIDDDGVHTRAFRPHPEGFDSEDVNLLNSMMDLCN